MHSVKRKSGAKTPTRRESIQTRLKMVSSSTLWSGFIIIVVVTDVIFTCLQTFAAMHNNREITHGSHVVLACFVVDIVLRLVADDIRFFTEKNRLMNIYELFVVIFCLLVEAADSDLPVGVARLLRPAMRMLRILRVPFRFVLRLVRSKTDVQSMMPVNMYCLYLHGMADYKNEVLKQLTKSKQPELFQSTAVKAIIEFKWQCYARTLIIRNLTIFIFYVLLWAAYAVLAYNDYWDRNEDGNSISGEKLHKDIIACIAILFTCNALYVEAWRFYIQGISYGKSFWNMNSFISNLTVFIVLVVELMDRHEGVMRSIAALVGLLLWTHTLYFLRGFRGTGALVRMIVQIVADMRYFMIIMIIMSVAFTQLFYTLQTPIPEANKPEEAIWAVYNAAWLGNYDAGFAGSILVRLMFGVMTLFMIIVLLNLLIAIMSNTFAIVNEGAAVEYYFNLAELTNELEMLMSKHDRCSVRRFPQYVIYSVSKSSISGDDDQREEQGTLGTPSGSFEDALDQILDYEKSADTQHHRVLKELEDIRKAMHTMKPSRKLEGDTDSPVRQEASFKFTKSGTTLLKGSGGLSRLLTVGPADPTTAAQAVLHQANGVIEQMRVASDHATNTQNRISQDLSQAETIWKHVQEERRLVHQEVTQMEWMWKQMRDERIKMERIRSGSPYQSEELYSAQSI